MNSCILLFPGQGSQFVGMGRDLAANFPEFSLTFEESSDILGMNMSMLCFEDPEKNLNLTEFTQPAILTMSTAIYRVLESRCPLTVGFSAGHSLGEYSALVAIGALEFAAALKAVQFRGQAMQRAVPVGTGAMAAYIGSFSEKVVAICAQESNSQNTVEVVNYNSNTQLVLSGSKLAVEKVCGIISAEKLGRAIPLAVSAPFHSSLMKPAADEMRRYFEKVKLDSFAGSIVANTDAKAHNFETYTKDILVRQVASPVLWTQSLRLMAAQAPDALFVEVGPGNVLQGLVKKTLDSRECTGSSEVEALKSLLKRLGT